MVQDSFLAHQKIYKLNYSTAINGSPECSRDTWFVLTLMGKTFLCQNINNAFCTLQPPDVVRQSMSYSLMSSYSPTSSRNFTSGSVMEMSKFWQISRQDRDTLYMAQDQC